MKVQKWWHRPRPVAFLNYGDQQAMSSEYVDEYIKRNIAATESCKPPYDLRKSDVRMSGDTTFRKDYIQHPLPEKRQVTKEIYKSPETAMEGTTMYKIDYPLLKAERAQLAKRKDTRSVPSGPFNAVPTYTDDFKRWILPPRVSFREDREFKFPTEKMENISTFRRDFIPHSASPRTSAKPPTQAFQSDQPLQSSTIHKISFVPHKLEPRQIREKQRFAPPTVSMNTTTTFKQDYMGIKVPPAESARPPQTHFVSTEPLASSSEFRDQFIVWPVEKPHRHEMDKYKKPHGDMDLRTTNRLDYKYVVATPPASKKPEVKRSTTMPFDGTTNYQTDFKKWTVRREPFIIREENLRPTGEFEGLSTTRQHYVRHSAQPARSCKPDGRAFMSEAPFDDHTIYRGDYIRQPMDRVERYPTPDWMKQQYEVWRKQGSRMKTGRSMTASLPRRGMTPQATQMVEVRA